MICKDCLHYEVCSIVPVEECGHFKDKNRFIEIEWPPKNTKSVKVVGVGKQKFKRYDDAQNNDPC